jgi:hypothetical protein
MPCASSLRRCYGTVKVHQRLGRKFNHVQWKTAVTARFQYHVLTIETYALLRGGRIHSLVRV